MSFFLQKIKTFIFAIEFIFLFRSVLISSSDMEINKINCKIIFINNIFIYIIENDNNIYKYNNEIIESYDSITKNKIIIKINDELFVIFGQNGDNGMYYGTFRISNTSNIIKKYVRKLEISYNSNGKYNVKCYSEKKCILSYFIPDNSFKIYDINLQENSPTEIMMDDNDYNDYLNSFGRINSFYDIICDSFNGENIFCIFSFQLDDTSWKIFYANGNNNKIINKNNQIKNNQILCEGQCFGNIVKEELNKKYLVCYKKYDTNIYVICQYFFVENDSILKEDEITIGELKGESIFKNPLILYIYENTIFIEVDVQASYNSLILMSSLDLKISIPSKYTHNSKFINLFNDNNYLYIIFENSSEGKTIIKQNDLISCSVEENIYFSDNEEQEIKFEEEHNNQYIIFSLDKSVKLENNGILVSSFKNNFIELKDSDIYKFKKIEDVNKLKNYFCYAKKEPSTGSEEHIETTTFYNEFSLICHINLKLCNERCKKCNLEKISTSSNQYCYECNRNFYRIQSQSYNIDGYNCYKDRELENYYLRGQELYPCDETCKSCRQEGICDICNDGYYFKLDENKIVDKSKCINEIPTFYFFDRRDNYYKPCYKSCQTCYDSGTESSNNCVTCRSGYTSYDFDNNQCTTSIEQCQSASQYWIFEDNNIKCIPKENCQDKIIIVEGKNKGQCIDDCKNYLHPFKTNDISLSYTFQCGEQNYCIPYKVCKNKELYIDNDNQECITYSKCEGSIDPYNQEDPYREMEIIPPTETPIISEIISINDKKNEISKRIKIIKMFSYENKGFKEVINNFDETLIKQYLEVLKIELSNNPNSKIYLITNSKYMNFTITIYPLDIEDFVYEQILLTNDLIFSNFTKLYVNFIEYEVSLSKLLLVCLMQYYTTNSPLNYVNYFLYSLNEQTYLGEIINQKNSNSLKKPDDKLDILYPLYNYINENSTLNKRNKENLVDNIKEMNSKYPKIDLSNINDPFYNDICFLFTSEVNTDMSLNDRRKEYYINVSLCENNCSLITILRKDIKTPRSLCNCDIKSTVYLNNSVGKTDIIPSISSYNGKVVSCITKTFNKNFLSSNIIFWIFILVFLFLISMIIAWIIFGKKELKKLLGLSNNNHDETNSEISIISNKNSKGNNAMDIKDKEKKHSKNDKNNVLSKSMIIPENKDKKYNNQMNSQQIEYLSAPINQSGPPKRKNQTISSSMTGNDNIKDELISDSEPSSFKPSTIKQNEKDNITDISFENIPNDEQIFVDNFLREKNMLNNNYLTRPINYENFLKLKMIRDSIAPLDKAEQKYYCNSCEDIYIPKNTKNNNNKKSTKKIGKNNIIQKFLLDGENLYDIEEEDSNCNNNLSDDYAEQKYEKIKEVKSNNNEINDNPFIEEKDFEGDQQFFFPGGILGQNGENILLDKNNKKDTLKKNQNNKNKSKKKLKGKKERKLEDYKNNDNNETETDNEIENNSNIIKIKQNKSKNNSRKVSARNRLIKSIGKNNFDDYDDEEEKKGNDENKKNEKLKTEYEDNARSKIKSELKKIANGEDDLNSTGGIFKRKKNNDNTLISNDNDMNNLVKSQNPNVLKLKSNSKNYYSKGNNKNDGKKNNKHYKNGQLKENNKNNKNDSSNRNMLDFQEEGEMNGDKGIPFNGEIISKKNDKNLNNNENNMSDIISNDKSSKNNKSEIELFNNKILVSSISDFLQTDKDKQILVEEQFFLYYWRYLNKRELCLVSFRDKKKTIPYFVRWSGFVFCLIFIFLISCLLFFEKYVHKRYLNALKGNKNSFGYYFKNEFASSIYAALISIVFKIIFIKIVLYRILKIKKEDKKMMSPSAEKRLDTQQLEELQNKRNKFLFIYKIKLIVFFSLLIAFSILFAYICICYAGVFHNSISYFLLGFIFSCIFSFIFCAFFCFIIVGTLWLGKKFKNRCILSTYYILSTMY